MMAAQLPPALQNQYGQTAHQGALPAAVVPGPAAPPAAAPPWLLAMQHQQQQTSVSVANLTQTVQGLTQTVQGLTQTVQGLTPTVQGMRETSMYCNTKIWNTGVATEHLRLVRIFRWLTPIQHNATVGQPGPVVTVPPIALPVHYSRSLLRQWPRAQLDNILLFYGRDPALYATEVEAEDLLMLIFTGMV
ncbi:hypothetical protein JCM10213_008359 [Rhodosporidiobolus nylandii]